MNAISVSMLVVGLACLPVAAQPQCRPLQSEDKVNLIDYVQKKYKTPRAAHLEMSEVSFVGSSCYRKIAFKAKEPQLSFHLTLFVAPDLRFLTAELLDSSVDPIEEEHAKAEGFAAGLLGKDAPIRGRADAPVTIAVFSDFQCPYCSSFAATMKDAMSPDSDKVKLVFHYFPLPMHPWARPAAEAAACVQQQGDSYFWAVHDFLFEHQRELSPEELYPRLAAFTKEEAGFDQSKFALCLVEKKTSAQIDRDVAFGQENGINGTPTAFVNGVKTQIVSPEQVRTLVRQLSGAPVGSKEAKPDR